MTEQTRPVYTERTKLSRDNFDTQSGFYFSKAVYPDGQEIDFKFEPKEYTNRYGENCIGNIHIPGNEFYVAIKTRVNKQGKIFYSGCINYDQKLFVNVNIVPTTDSIKEYTVAFSKPSSSPSKPDDNNDPF